MMLSLRGTFTYNLDQKNRVNIPAKFRREGAFPAPDAWVLSRGMEGCIALYPREEWERLESKLDKLEFTRKNHRHFKRLMLRDVSEVTTDKQGRIPISKNLLEFANIEKTVLIQGMVSYIELWCPEVYEKYLESQELSIEDLAESVYLEKDENKEK
ncbi:MAG: division/cell wall cluster transcriptional repressor MraZ [candidate division Zixibacteria bacterium]|nr:division/cell wall cluster transcriptional repressor MraZ [candidate division Zixibacteria bacterium]